MKKIITIFGALAVASSPTIALRSIAPHKTQKLHYITKKTNDIVNNDISVLTAVRTEFKFTVTLSSSDYNGFSGFLDQISFKLSDYNYHAWPLYLFQWLDDDDYHSGPMPALNSHTKHGFFHDPVIWPQRLETCMSDYGFHYDDKSDTAFDMSTCWGQWGTFGQTVDNAWNAGRAASKPYVGIIFNFDFLYSKNWNLYSTVAPTYYIITT